MCSSITQDQFIAIILTLLVGCVLSFQNIWLSFLRLLLFVYLLSYFSYKCAHDSLKLFSVAGIIGIFILLPINYFGQQLSEADISDIPSQSLDLFTISNVKDGSKW